MKAKKMAKKVVFKLIILGCLLAVLVYFLTNKDYVIREHLTPGPPTLLTLQTDTQDIDKRLTDLKSDFDSFKSQAKQGADAAASARAQISATKYSPAPSPP
jgi:hypothetical protein